MKQKRRARGKLNRLALHNLTLARRGGGDMMRSVKRNLILAWILMVVFALSRWPGLMPPNCSAAYALAFCAGLYLPGAMGWIGPLAVLTITDILLHIFFYPPSPWPQALAPELGYVALIALGKAFGGKRPLWLLIGGGLLGAVLFYFITNTAAWLSLPYYSKNMAGWIQALTGGMPGYPPTWEFFRNTLWSGGIFTGLFVGAMKLAEPAEEKKEEPEAEAEPEPKSGEAEAS